MEMMKITFYTNPMKSGRDFCSSYRFFGDIEIFVICREFGGGGGMLGVL